MYLVCMEVSVLSVGRGFVVRKDTDLFSQLIHSMHSTPTPEYLATHCLCQKDRSVFHLFEIRYSQESPT